MGISSRTVQNKRDRDGQLTGRPGTVYDVNVKYKFNGERKTYSKKGFPSKKDATQHEAEMKTKLSSAAYLPITAMQGKMSVQDYMESWVESHGKSNLRPSTLASYRGYIRNHIVPHVGKVQLKQLSPAMLDDMFQKMFAQGLSQSSVRYSQRILSVALEAARKYRYIETNPARDIITKFGKQGKTPDPYTVSQMQQLMANVAGSEWEIVVMLGGLYGLRISEILGLRWRNINMTEGTLSVVEQLPFRMPAGTTIITEMAPTKSNDRVLPITNETRSFFERQQTLQDCQRSMGTLGGAEHYENDLVVAKPNGAPFRRESMSANFGQLIRRMDLPHIRFHDLRHTAATNMHQLTGDFYTVGEILGHTLKGIGISLGISTNLEAVTAQYVDVRLERKRSVLETYHKAIFTQSE